MSDEPQKWVQMDFWSFRSLLEPSKPLYLRPDDAKIAEALVNDLARVGLVTVDNVFTVTFECEECGSILLAPQFRFREGRSFRFRDYGCHNYIPPVTAACSFCHRKKHATENEVVCQGLERSVP